MTAASIVALSFILATPKVPQHAQTADQLLNSYGKREDFPAIMRDSLTTFLTVEDLYAKAQYKQAKKTLDQFWTKYPPATTEWRNFYSQSASISATTGINIGTPTCYYALRMYDECLRWRTGPQSTVAPLTTATLTVVIVGQSQGIQPSNKAELANKTGSNILNKLDPQLDKEINELIGESTELFAEYIRAASLGKLAVKIQIVKLPDLTIPVSVENQFAGMTGNAMEMIWKNLPAKTLNSTDWWWVIYPSHVPEKYPDFKTTEFITGGMGTGPDSNSPCFISDDRWITRKPPHLGQGPYTTFERRAYLPQWLQHEMAHHWFRTWPEFQLEAKDHQWFDRSTWPENFVGHIEPDYYAEALNKILQPKANPPIHVALLYAPPPTKLFQSIDPKTIVGKYEHQPRQNDWHTGEIQLVNGKYFWQNQAGARWSLILDLSTGKLKTAADCPYTPQGSSEGPPFNITLQRNQQGQFTSEFIGFTFNGSLYKKVK